MNQLSKGNCDNAISYFNPLHKKAYYPATQILGTMYHNGLCLKKNFETSFKYFDICKGKFEGLCLAGIAGHYLNGDGVSKDNIKSYMFYKLSYELLSDEEINLAKGVVSSKTIIKGGLEL